MSRLQRYLYLYKTVESQLAKKLTLCGVCIRECAFESVYSMKCVFDEVISYIASLDSISVDQN
jgi:hypothetical protein